MSAPGAAEPVVAVRVGDEEYGIPVGSVREVRRAGTLAPAAGAEGVVAGVAVVGEERIPVLDLRVRLGAGGAAGKGGRLVVVRHPVLGPLALRVDAAAGVREIDPTRVEPVPRFFPAGAGGVRGIARDALGVLILLEVEGLLTGDEVAMVKDNVTVAT